VFRNEAPHFVYPRIRRFRRRVVVVAAESTDVRQQRGSVAELVNDQRRVRTIHPHVADHSHTSIDFELNRIQLLGKAKGSVADSHPRRAASAISGFEQPYRQHARTV